MKTGRRYFLSTFTVMLAGTTTMWAAGQRQLPPVPSAQVPDASRDSNRGQPDEMPPFPVPDPREQLKESQKNLRRDADRLLQLANDLKDEAYKTEQTDVLSLSLMHKAEEVEKLAKQIRNLVRAV